MNSDKPWYDPDNELYYDGMAAVQEKLVRVMNAARNDEANRVEPAYLRALHDIAEAMGMHEIVEVRYVA